MKKSIYIIFCSFVFTASVTFYVDMQEQYVSENGIFLAGSDTETELFFGDVGGIEISPWTPDEIQMIDDDFDGVYSITVELQNNTSFIYKFVNGDLYEFEGGENRVLITGEQDMLLDVACYNKLDEICEDSDNSLVEVVFTVDMQNQEISENGIHVLGANEDISNFGYNQDGSVIPPYDPVSTELIEIDNYKYQVSIYMEPGILYTYKFVNGDNFDGVEQADRTVRVSDVAGVNLNEVCYGEYEDCNEFDTVINQLTFKTDLSKAISSNGFDTSNLIILKWGYGGSLQSEENDTLSLQAFSEDYKITFNNINVDQDVGIYYQYYKIVDDEESREIFFNFDYTGDDIVLAERRYFSFEGIEDFSEISIFDDLESNVDQRRMPVFSNTESIGQEVDVTWTIDLRPAYYQILAGDVLDDIQGIYSVDNVDSLYEWGVWINGPASYPANGENWTQWGSTLYNTNAKKMWDDGTHGDAVSGDRIYTIQLTYAEDSTIGQECKFGIKGGDNESSYGLNHYENIDVNNPNINVYWGSINPIFYNSWDYDSNEPNDFCTFMDLNFDGIINVIDIIAIILLVLSQDTPSNNDLCKADINQDGLINVTDIVALVSQVLNQV